ncbi:winged helix-turn-helix domain-containing protein [Sinosporangium album]|nr:winged helix-turn-helix domain-containing protein [Sinosporangium album]
MSLDDALGQIQGRGLHVQVAHALLRRIAHDAYPPGSFLPSEHALTARFRCSRLTLRRALQALAELGIVTVVPHKGWRLRPLNPDEPPRDYRYQLIAADIRRKITTGRYPIGMLIPGEIDLARLHHCSRATIRRALAMLEEERLLVCLKHIGRRVAHSSTASDQRASTEPRPLRVLEPILRPLAARPGAQSGARASAVRGTDRDQPGDFFLPIEVDSEDRHHGTIPDPIQRNVPDSRGSRARGAIRVREAALPDGAERVAGAGA